MNRRTSRYRSSSISSRSCHNFNHRLRNRRHTRDSRCLSRSLSRSRSNSSNNSHPSSISLNLSRSNSPTESHHSSCSCRSCLSSYLSHRSCSSHSHSSSVISLTSNDDNNNNPQGLPTVRVQVIDLAEEQELELQTLNLQAAESWVPVPSLSPLPDPEVQDFIPMPLPTLNEEVNQELVRRETHRSCTGCHLPCTTDLQHWCLGCQILCPYHQYAYRRNLTVYWSPTHPGSSELTCHLASRVGPATPPLPHPDPFHLQGQTPLETFGQIRQHLRKQAHPRRVIRQDQLPGVAESSIPIPPTRTSSLPQGQATPAGPSQRRLWYSSLNPF